MTFVNEQNIYPEKLYSLLKKQGYHWVGQHSATKKCKWLHESLVNNRTCYKEKFYGIRSHRCMQISPAVLNCLTSCLHCWRAMPEDVGSSWNSILHGKWDNPEHIADGLFLEHRRILSGYNAQVIARLVDKKKYSESLKPNQVAISLSGEPTLYPYLPELISILKKRGCTVFLVTSGVIPKALEKLIDEECEPTILYLSLTSPNLEKYLKINRPISPDIWNSLIRSIDVLRELKCKTVLRITAIRNINMSSKDISDFANIMINSNSEIEVKGYMHVGFSTNRLSEVNMPLFNEIKDFSEKLGDSIGYHVKDSSYDSRVILLSRS